MDWTPGRIKPMEPYPHQEPFDSEKHLFEIKWDGMRLLAFIRGQEVRLQNRSLIERTNSFPELKDIHQYFQGKEGIIDGELVALDNGKPSFPLLMKRCSGSNATAASKASQIPVIFIPFDLLYLNGKELTKKPLTERKALLMDNFSKGPFIIPSPVFEEGISLFEKVKSQELEGIVAKSKNTPYLIGKKSRYWLKIKNRRKQAVVIGGYVVSSGQLSSILVGAYWEEELIYLGRVGTGFGKMERELLSLLSQLKRSIPSFDPQPKLKIDLHWVEPLLTAEIEFQEWTPDLKLRQPVFIRLLEKEPSFCRLLAGSKENNNHAEKPQ